VTATNILGDTRSMDRERESKAQRAGKLVLLTNFVAFTGLASMVVQNACNKGTAIEDDVGGTGSGEGAANVGGQGAGGSGIGGMGGMGGGPLENTDPQDLDTVNGDPALDVIGSQSYLDGEYPWLRVQFAASWMPPGYYSWFCTVYLESQGTEVASYTVQLHDGVSDNIATGIPLASTTFTQEPNGFRVLFAAPIQADSYRIEAGVLKTVDGTYVQDDAGPYPFVSNARSFPD
jgi:hypothetical protein